MATEWTFEKAMTRLEQIVAALEGGKCSLDDSLKLFEEGTKLTAYCSKLLKEAEQKIVKLTDLEQGGGVEMNDRQGEDMGEELSD
jgi:exodeoxyribonuclease VII small subunit